jgi:ABC-type polar amino acid transport system ATPase subunit
MPLLALRSISKRFGAHLALDAVTLEIEPGEVVAIIGRSGSGKSTLLRCINGLELPDSGTSLSGGQQQRVAIARAIAMAPRLMLFDEITAALDAELIGEVVRVLETLAQDGMTMVLVTHEMGFARRSADTIVFMHHGKIWEQGPPAKLFEAPETAELASFIDAILSVDPAGQRRAG